MPAFEPETIAAWTGGRWTRLPQATVTGFSTDSRGLAAGEAFVALRTGRRDGHDFVRAAGGGGASAALVSSPVSGTELAQLVVADPLRALQAIAREHRARFGGVVVAVTGSAGKTSTKEMIATFLGPDGVLATQGNLNNHIGVALTLCRIDPSNHRFAVVEAGISAPGEMSPLAAMISPDIAVVTLVGPAHLAELGGLEGVAREKAVLAQAVRAGGTAFTPVACEAFAPFRALGSRVVVRSVESLGAGGPAAGTVLFSAAHSVDHTVVSVATAQGSRVEVVLPRISDGMASNAAFAVAAALAAGAAPAEVRDRAPGWSPAPLRGEWISGPGRTVYLDCYNANPASMADALEYFTSVAAADKPRLFVIGCMEDLGSDGTRFHGELGRSLPLRPQDRIVVVGANAESVRSGALERGASPGQIETAAEVDSVAASFAAFRGWVFVKGSRAYGLERAFREPAHAEASHA